MLLVANLLCFGSGIALVLLALSPRPRNPEGPVGFHMVTGPLALAQAAAVALALAAGAAPAFVGATWLGWVLVPGQVVGLTILPFIAIAQRQGAVARGGVIGAVVGCVALLHGTRLGPASQWLGLALVGAVAAFGYGVLIAEWLQGVRNRAASLRADQKRMTEFEANQAAFQRAEWATVPADAPLWRLVQFTHSFADEVRTEARARAAALPDLDAAMIHLLQETGWQDQGMRYIRDGYPGSRAALAGALGAHLAKERVRWRKSLDDAPQPGSYYGNVLSYIETAAAVQQDGGDLRAELGRWAAMLKGRSGLEGLARRCKELAAAPS